MVQHGMYLAGHALVMSAVKLRSSTRRLHKVNEQTFKTKPFKPTTGAICLIWYATVS